MNILILSNSPWREDNSFGNTFSNFFQDKEKYNICNVYCGQGLPNSSVPTMIFNIDEGLMIKSILNKNIKTGNIVSVTLLPEKKSQTNRIIDNIKKHKFIIFYTIREIIWMFGKWKSKELIDFINSANIDLIFQPIYSSFYINRISKFFRTLTNKPMVCFTADDAYTFKQYKLSPAFWIDRIFKRFSMKNIIDTSKILYVISDIQKQEYDKCFKKECKLLYKSAEFSKSFIKAETKHKPIKLIFTGNINLNRWKSLAMIGKALEKINDGEIQAQLFIYTATLLTKKMKKALTIENSIMMMGSVSSSEIQKIQEDSDILVHVESFNLKNKLEVRLSFSTKIVDYLSRGKCILAVGPPDVASIDYLIKNDAAIVATKKEDIYFKLLDIISNKSILDEYSQKAYFCGKKNHNKKVIQEKLYDDLKAVITENYRSR